MSDKVTACWPGRVLWTILTVLAVTGTSALAEVSTLENVNVTTMQDHPVTFVISAEDTDIDPYELIMHPILFALVEGPAHGTVVGGLQDVHYLLPDKASVTVTYQPDGGFVGDDVFTIAVVDPDDDDSEIVTVRIEVTKTRGVQHFTGTWDAEMGLDLQSIELSAFAQRLAVLYQVDVFALKGIADLALEGAGGSPTVAFDALRFEASALVGDLSVYGVLAFDPNALLPASLFDYLLTNVSGHIGDVFVAHTLYLTDPQVQSYQAVSLQGSVAGVGFGNTMRWDMKQGCGFAFSRNDTQVRWEACGAQLHATLAMLSTGFQSLSFGADDISVPWTAELFTAIALSPSVTFTTADKTFSLSMDWQPDIWACVRLFSELKLSGAGLETIDAISLYGLVVEFDVPDAVHVESATSLDPAKNSVITDYAAYSEALTISGDLASCCSGAGTWSIATYFRDSSTALFDWGETLVEVSVVLSDGWTVGGALTVRAAGYGDPTVEVALSWQARW